MGRTSDSDYPNGLVKAVMSQAWKLGVTYKAVDVVEN